MKDYSYMDLRQRPQIKDMAAEWFSKKWNIPKTAYLACMDDYLTGKTAYGWFLCLDGERIVGGLGVIENDFHDRKDLTPNVCAVYTEKEYRGRGIAGRLLGMALEYSLSADRHDNGNRTGISFGAIANRATRPVCRRSGRPIR